MTQKLKKHLYCNWIILFCLILFPAPANSIDYQIKEFPIPTSYSRSVDIAMDSKGDVWFVEENANKLGKFDVKNSAFEEFEIPYKNAGPSSISIKLVPASLKQGGDVIWLALALDNSVASFTPSSKTFKRFEIPAKNAGLYNIAVDASGIVWFTERNANKIGKFDPSKNIFKEYPIQTQNSQPSGIAINKDGLVWFTESIGNNLGVLDPKTEKITEYEVLSSLANPSDLTIDNKGNIWFIEIRSNKIGMFDASAKKFNNAIIPTLSSVPTSIAIDKNNIVWFTENKGNKIGRFDPETAMFAEFDIETQRSLPTGIAVDEDNTVWFTQTDRDANKLGMLKKQLAVGSEQLPVEIQKPASKTFDKLSIIGGIVLISIAVIILYLTMRKGRNESSK